MPVEPSHQSEYDGLVHSSGGGQGVIGCFLLACFP